jgi:hypothetical protein
VVDGSRQAGASNDKIENKDAAKIVTILEDWFSLGQEGHLPRFRARALASEILMALSR